MRRHKPTICHVNEVDMRDRKLLVRGYYKCFLGPGHHSFFLRLSLLAVGFRFYYWIFHRRETFSYLIHLAASDSLPPFSAFLILFLHPILTLFTYLHFTSFFCISVNSIDFGYWKGKKRDGNKSYFLAVIECHFGSCLLVFLRINLNIPYLLCCLTNVLFYTKVVHNHPSFHLSFMISFVFNI